MTELEHALAVNRRLRHDLKKTLRIARLWKERWYSLCWCTDPSHRRSTICPPVPIIRKPGHAPRLGKV